MAAAPPPAPPPSCGLPALASDANNNAFHNNAAFLFSSQRDDEGVPQSNALPVAVQTAGSSEVEASNNNFIPDRQRRPLLQRYNSKDSVLGVSFFEDQQPLFSWIFDERLHHVPSTVSESEVPTESRCRKPIVERSDSRLARQLSQMSLATSENQYDVDLSLVPGASRSSMTSTIVHRQDRESKINGNGGATLRPSWLVEGGARRKEDNDSWRKRRKTDPGDTYGHVSSYHKDYREALSSLLWQPYDCRDSSNNIISSDQESDPAGWVFPPRNVERPTRPSTAPWDAYHFTGRTGRAALSVNETEVTNWSYGQQMPQTTSVASATGDGDLSLWTECSSSDSTASECALPPLGALGAGRAVSEGHLPSRCRQCLCDCEAGMLVAVEPGGAADGPGVTTASGVCVVNCNSAGGNSSGAVQQQHVSNVQIVQGGRTFTSTEAQTDDLPTAQTELPQRNNNREQRRRERRERRQQRRLNSVNAAPPPEAAERLPDILHSHLPPPYSTLPVATPVPVALPTPLPVAPPPPPHPVGIRFPFQLSPPGRRRSRRSHYTAEEEPKSCCGLVVTQTVSIRWFIVMIAFVGVCCAVVGTVLGAMKASGREHLTVSLLMIGVGIVLITVSGVAWRLTAHDAPSCRSMLGLGDAAAAEPNRRFVPRLPPSYGRPHHPYAAMMYPEFQYRAPPPSYQASMQEYRLRLLLLDRQPQGHTVSPPPTYRSHAGSTLSRVPLGLRRDPPQTEYSRPPSYRSRTSSTRPTLDPNGPEHSRDPSLSESGDSGKVRLPLESKEGNLVTIVQTDDAPVIVTVSGCTPAPCSSEPNPEMEILAHL